MVKGKCPIDPIHSRKILGEVLLGIIGDTNILEVFEEDSTPKYSAIVQPNNIGLSFTKVTPIAGAFKLEQYRNKFHKVITELNDSVPFDLIIESYLSVKLKSDDMEMMQDD